MRPTLAQCLSGCLLPKNEARILLQYCTGYTRSQLITHDTEIISEQSLEQFHTLVQRRQNGEPIAYLLGYREFYGRRFAVSPDVLIPRPETEHLLEAALFRLPENGVLWDLGTGSGILAISAKSERADVSVFASDFSESALKMAQHNAQNWGAEITWGLGSWFDCQFPYPIEKYENYFDVLVSNPPYIEQHDGHLNQGDLRFEPPHALTDFADGLSHIKILISNGKKYLKPNGYLLLEHGYNQAAQIRDLFQQHDYKNIETQTDLAGLDRITFAQK